MKDLQDIVIVVKNTDGDSLEIVTSPDSDADAWAHLFRTIMFWLTFSPETIDDFIVPVDGWPEIIDEKEGEKDE